MKIKTMIMSTVMAISMLLVGCAAPAPTPDQASWIWVETYCDEFQNNQHIGKAIDLRAGDTLVIVLCSNPTTGFQWSEEAQISGTGILKQENHEFVGPESEPPPPPGTPGLQTWRFQTLNEGSSTVSIEYSRPWEGGEKGEWIFTLNVDVK
jgi:inhibitor of cysteine peptidase